MAVHRLSVRLSEKLAGVIFLNADDAFLDQQLTRKQWDKLLASGDHEFVSVDWIAFKGMPRDEVIKLRMPDAE